MKPIYSFSTKLGIAAIAFSCASLLSFAQVAHVKEAPDSKLPLTPEKTVTLSFSVSGLPDDAYLIGGSCNYIQATGRPERRFSMGSYNMGPAVSIDLRPDQSDKKTLTGSTKIPGDIASGEYTLRGCLLQFNSTRLKNDGEPDFDGPVRFDPALSLTIKK